MDEKLSRFRKGFWCGASHVVRHLVGRSLYDEPTSHPLDREWLPALRSWAHDQGGPSFPPPFPERTKAKVLDGVIRGLRRDLAFREKLSREIREAFGVHSLTSELRQLADSWDSETVVRDCMCDLMASTGDA